MEEAEPARALTEVAAEWLHAIEAGTADRHAFEAWRSADPRHALAFVETVCLWRALGALEPQAPSKHVAPQPAVIEPAVEPAIPRRRFLAAASVAGISALGGAGWLLDARPATARTTVGERRLIALDDGSRVELNTNSEAAWRFRRGSRELWLRLGEIAIDVVDGPQPLILHALDQTMSLATGRYNARLINDRLDLLVLSGLARAAASGSAVPAGAMLTAVGDDEEIRPSEARQLARADAWRRGELVFDGDSLAFAVAEFNRHLLQPIVIADPALGTLRLGGRFNVTEGDAFLAAVEAGLGLHVARTADGGAEIRSAG